MTSELPDGHQSRVSEHQHIDDTVRLLDFSKAGLRLKSLRDGVAIFGIPGFPRVEFNLRRNRWKARNEKKTTHGTDEEFIAWYRQNYLERRGF